MSEQLYKQLKSGQINKSQLSDKQIGEVYKYMVDSNKVSANELKPAVAKKYNIGSQPVNNSPIRQEPFKVSDYVNLPQQMPTYTPSRSPDTNAPITPNPRGNITPDIGYKQSTNPEMALVDVISNITMPTTRGQATQHERSRGSAYVPQPIVQSTPSNLTLGDRAEHGIKGIGYNWAGGNLSSVGTIAELGQQGIKSRLERDVPQQSFYAEDLKDKSIPTQQYANTEKAYITDALNASKTRQADELLAKGSEHTFKGREGLGTAGGVAYDILTGAGQMTADIGTAAVTGVGMLPVLGTRVFGQGASEARQSGATIDQQIAYGAISAGIEIATEKLVGGLPMAEKLGMGGVADDALHNGAIKLAKMIKGSPRLAKAFVYLTNMAGEGAEEAIAEILSPLAKRLTYDPNANLAEFEEIAYSALIGAGVSGVMGGGVIGNSMVDFDISESYNPTPKHEFDVNNYQYNPNNGVQQQPEQTYQADKNIQGLQETISQGLGQIYNQLQTNTETDNTQSIDTMINTLNQTKQSVPELSNFVDGHIEILNNFKAIKQPQTNEINQVEQSIEQDTNVPQIEDKGVTEDIKEIDNIIPIESLKPQELLQDSNENVTEMQQIDNVTNVTEETTIKLNKDNKGNALSKEQQETLKDSKLKDKDGNILLVYHGTDGKFDKFEPNQAPGWGTGIYFTDNIENAKEYGDNIIESYLNIKKPFYDTDRKVDISETKAYREYADKIVERRAEEESMTIEEYLEEDGYPDWELEWDNLYNEDGDIEVISKALQELGYDAFIGENSNNIKGKEIVVFNSDQIQRVVSQETNTQAIEQPTTNETIQGEQIVEEDTNISKVEDKSTEEETKTEQQPDVTKNETTETQDNKKPLNLNNYTFQYKDELTIDYDKVRKATVAGGLEAHAYSLPSSDTIRVVIEGESSVHPKTIYKKNILTVNGRPSNWQETTTETAKTENAQIEININNFMDSVNENDIDFKKAESAYRAVSFDPDKRAKSIQKDYVNTVKRVYDELLPLAKTDEQKVILLEEMQKFKENYLKKQNAVLDATSRTMSSMITGPANFPVARNQKALDTEHKRMVEFSEWYNKAIPSIKKKIEGIKPEIDKFNENVTETKQTVTGKKGIAKDNEGNAIEFVYEVINAKDLITSHTTELAVNNNYPSELQPRDRNRAAGQLQVNDIINNLQPEFLGENPKISDGAPIIGSDNIVESGNGRTIALTKMYEMKHDNSNKYVKWLNANAEAFGINAENLPDNPVLIRRRTTDVDRVSFVKKANESSVASMSATETARSDADKLTNEVLSLFVANENGIINTTDNKGFIGKFIGEVIPKNEQNKYITDKGELSQEGLARVRNAIFYKAYGDINLMNKLAESLDNNAKNITNAMLAIAPKIVDIKTDIAKGNLYNIDYSSDIAQAANEYMALKETGKDVELYLQQESLFDNEDTALIKDIMAIFNANNRSAKKMTAVFNKLFDTVENLGNPNQINILNETETYNKADVLEATLRRLENEDNAQVTIFQTEREESTGDTKGNQGKQTTKGFKGGESYTGKTNADLIDMSRKLKKPTEIRKDITKKFNIPTSTKKFNRSKKFLGYYKIMPEVIRLRYDNDIGTVMHELGHHFDKKYGFNSLNKQLITDMVNKMNPAFKKNYQKSELPGEAIAEFLRYYTTDSTTAKEFAGDFYDLFEQTLSKEDLKNIQEVRSDVLRWVNAEQTEKAMSTNVSLTEQNKADSKKKIEEATAFEKYNTMLFSEYAAIERFTKTVESLTGRKLRESLNPYVLIESTYQNDGLINGLMTGQLRDTKSEPIKTDDNLGKIIDDANNDIRKFEHYLKLKRAAHLLRTKGHMFYATDIYSGVDDMQQNLDLLEQEYPQFVELSGRLYNWYNKFFKAWVIDTKMLGKDSEKIYKEMRKQDPYYVPLFRVKENGGIRGFTNSIADQKAEVYRLGEKGNDQDTTSPLDNVAMQVARIVNSYTKNNVLRAITNQYNTVDGLGIFLDRVPPDMVKQLVSTENVKIMLEEEFADVDDIDDIIQSIPDMIQGYKTSAKSKEVDVIGVIAEDGSKQFYQVFDKPLLDSLTRMNPIQLDTYVKMIGKMTRFTTGLTTGLNPIFGITSNAWRDFVQAWILGSHKDPATYMLDYVKSIFSVMAKTEKYKRFKELGGVYGSSITSELRSEKKARNDIIRRLHKYRKGQKISAKNAISLVTELILDFNDAIETAPRLSEFNKAYKIAKNKKGYTEQDALMYAMKKSKNVTLHFARRGTIKSELPGQAILYLGAGLQGVDRLRRGLFTKEEAPQVWIKSITTLTLGTILLWMVHRDDEDYEKLTDGIKDSYWILWKNPDGSFVRVPKPKDLAAIFSSSAERTMNAFFKEEGAGAFEGWQTTLVDALLPPVSTVFRPIFDVWKNEKWSGGKIVPMAMDYLPKTEQHDETTSKIGVELAQLIGKIAPDSNFASPKNVDYVLDQYYGGLADILLPIATPTSYVDVDTLRDKYNYLAMPMAALMKVGDTIGRKFKADPSYSNNAVNDFYDLRDKTTKANNAYKNRSVMSDDVDFISENQFKAYYKSISSMWKTVDYIDGLANKALPDGHKESYEELIKQSRFADSEKKKVIEDLKDNKLNRESITMLQKTIRDEIVNLADRAVKDYKANHKENNEYIRRNTD